MTEGREMEFTINGEDLKKMFAAATNWLEKIVPDINALNVYPVPDGDCGTNMLFTMRASLAEAAQIKDNRISAVTQAMAKGALMGARGNSGVILSQIWRGFEKSLKSKIIIGGKEFAEALCEASKTAYHALSSPVEGTILTVIKDAADAASKAATTKGNLVSVMETSVSAARDSVARTPKLLQVLKDAGVVDAGGHGLYTLLEGALLHLKGDIDKHSPELIASIITPVVKSVEVTNDDEAYGFCTQFLLSGNKLDANELREQFQDKGKSLIVVGDDKTLRVHIHTIEPETITRLASTYGTLFDIDIRNMDEQHKDFLLTNKEKAAKVSVAVVAVVNGDGLANVFSSLGVSAIVPGGQTMNPSTMDILQAVEAVPPDNVIILPNNKNIVLTATQVQSLTGKKVVVIPTETIPQGITAMIAFTNDADIIANSEQMTEAISRVRTLEITRATRTTRLDGLQIKEGQAIGLLDGKLYAAADKAVDVIFDLLSRIDISEAGILSIYYGAGAQEADAEVISKRISQQFPSLEMEVINGGQPHYNYLISVE